MNRVIQMAALALVLGGCARQEEKTAASDMALREKIVGTWVHGEEKPGVGWSGGATTIRRDGTCSSRFTNRWDGGLRRFAYEGTWFLKGGVLVFGYTKSSAPNLIPVGTVQQCKIVRLDDSMMAWRDPTQEATNLFIMRRSRQQPPAKPAR